MAGKSAYITPEGYRRLQAEADELWRVERPRVTKEVATAAAHGDRSENAEYIYGKKRLREIDARLRFLRRRLEALTVVDGAPADPHRVFFGAWVTLEDEQGEQHRYRLVGPDELDPARGQLSIDSPIGRALLGRRIDEAFEVRRPRGVATFVVVDIAYQDAEGGETSEGGAAS